MEVTVVGMKRELEELGELQKCYMAYKDRFMALEKAFKKLETEKDDLEVHYLKLLSTT